MRLGILGSVAILPVIAGCATLRPAQPHIVARTEVPDRPVTWQWLITPQDKTQLTAIGDTWTRALAGVPKRLAPMVAGEGPLVEPDAALDHPALPPGPYYCRLIRFGGRPAVATFKPDFCIVAVSGDAVSFTKQGGSRLFGGWLFADADSDTRQIFLGTFRQHVRPAGPRYGTDPARDVAGVVERVSAFRWRLSLTRAGKGATLDVYELVPVTPKVPGAMPAVPG